MSCRSSPPPPLPPAPSPSSRAAAHSRRGRRCGGEMEQIGKRKQCFCCSFYWQMLLELFPDSPIDYIAGPRTPRPAPKNQSKHCLLYNICKTAALAVVVKPFVALKSQRVKKLDTYKHRKMMSDRMNFVLQLESRRRVARPPLFRDATEKRNQTHPQRLSLRSSSRLAAASMNI